MPILSITILVLTVLTGAAAAQTPSECRISVLGDSLTAAYGLPIEEGFPSTLEMALRERGFNCTVIDAGVSGDTSAGGAARVDWVLADDPSHLIVELGGNDALRAIPPETLEHNLKTIVEKAHARNVSVFMAGMLAPVNLGEAYRSAFEQAFQTVAKENGLPLYPFFLEGVALNPELMQSDGIHPNAAGVRELVRRITPHIEDWLTGTGNAG